MRAEFHLFNDEYEQAAKIYENLLENSQNNNNLWFHLSLCYLNDPNESKKAIYYLKKVFSDSTLSNYHPENDYYIYLDNLYKVAKEGDSAKPQKVHKGFKFDPYKPVTNIALSGNGEILVFVDYINSEKNIFCIRKENGIWSEAKNITSQLGAEGKYFPSSLSYDGIRLYLTKYDNFESDIYVSTYNGKSWSGMKKLNGHINSLYFDSRACETPDGNVLYFASNRPGGNGGMDIYFSLKIKGDWSKPVNAGLRINTALNEDYPIFTNEGRTLIFSSQGFKKGKDGYDLYFCNNVVENLWTVPVNLGYPVNTPEDDINYVPLTEESHAYFNLNCIKPKNGESIKGDYIITSRGTIKQKNNKIALSDISINIINNSKPNEIVFKINSNDLGKFVMELKPGDYTLKLTANNKVIKTINYFIPFAIKPDTVSMEIFLE
jgi:hypothetical protein